jgi:hypothetical protein
MRDIEERKIIRSKKRKMNNSSSILQVLPPSLLHNLSNHCFLMIFLPSHQPPHNNKSLLVPIDTEGNNQLSRRLKDNEVV